MYYYKKDGCYFCFKQPCNEDGFIAITKEEFTNSITKDRFNKFELTI